MKLGFVSAILPNLSFEEVIDFASDNGFKSVELMCWPIGKAIRRYAGVTHIDVNNISGDKIQYIREYCKRKNVEISSLGYYPNPLDEDKEKRDFYIQHIKKVIDAAEKLNIPIINTFIGNNHRKSIDENINMFEQIWPDIIKYAKDKQIKIAIENCPMFFTGDEWPGGKNLAYSPYIWRKMFSIIPDENFGLNYDPSHLIWQQLDYIKPVYEFKDRIFHVHIKDSKILEDSLKDKGILSTPLEFHIPKLPGFGDINWGKFFSALTDIKYKGSACIEVEDKAFEDSLNSRKKAIKISKQYVKPFFGIN